MGLVPRRLEYNILSQTPCPKTPDRLANTPGHQGHRMDQAIGFKLLLHHLNTPQGTTTRHRPRSTLGPAQPSHQPFRHLNASAISSLMHPAPSQLENSENSEKAGTQPRLLALLDASGSSKKRLSGSKPKQSSRRNSFSKLKYIALRLPITLVYQYCYIIGRFRTIQTPPLRLRPMPFTISQLPSLPSQRAPSSLDSHIPTHTSCWFYTNRRSFGSSTQPHTRSHWCVLAGQQRALWYGLPYFPCLL